MNESLLNLLVVEDDEADFLLLERALRKQMTSFRTRRVASYPDLETALVAETWDVVLSDYSVPGMDFEQSLALIHARVPHLPVILISGSVGEEQAVSLVKLGVWDFVLKDNLVRLGSAVERALQEAAERRARTDAQAALREAESALRTLVNAIPESAILTDVDGIILAANETIARRFGKIPRQLLGTQFYDLLPPDVAEVRRRHAAECVRTGEARRFEDMRYSRFIDNYVYPIKDEHGQVKKLAVLGVDVTEAKAAEARLKEQAALLDVASDAILVKDLENRILYWSKGAQRVYGWTAEEAAGGKTTELLFSQEYAAEASAAHERTVDRGEWNGDLHQRAKDGRELIVEGRWTLVRNEDGSPKAILSVNSDVTAQRSVQAQLLRSQRLESLGTLAGGIAHDLNNVLSPILMGVEGLSFHDPDVSTTTILEIIKASAQRGASIVRQILNFARGMEGARGEVQLKHVLREIEEIVRETFDRSITVKSTIPRDLWCVMGDATQLHQVVMNLCVNARDAMPGGGELCLCAENTQLDSAYAQMNIEAKPIRYVVMTVHDSGMGMTREVQEKIFDPFFTTKEPGKGTGLGLSSARSIVKSHGGFINVTSDNGRGATFKVYIPAVEHGGAPSGESEPQAAPRGEGELILVVDDESSMRDITRHILESCGYRVATAVDGTDALSQYVERKAEIRLVITDMMMPFMDGSATIRAIRKISPGARFIATSGLMISEYANEAKDLGAQAFLIKPFTSETLLHTLRKVLAGDGQDKGT